MKAFGRHGRALLIIAALWLLNELIAMLVQGSYQQDANAVGLPLHTAVRIRDDAA